MDIDQELTILEDSVRRLKIEYAIRCVLMLDSLMNLGRRLNFGVPLTSLTV